VDTVTPTAFARWLAEMQAGGKAKSDAECGRLLGVTARQVLNMKRGGATQQTALACAALLKGMKEFGSDK
jgi:hypothetical protein